MRMPDHHHQILQVGQRFCAVEQGSCTGLHESRTQQQIFGRIAAQTQLRCEHQSRTCGMRLARKIDNLLHIARQITDRRIDLREGYFH